MKLAVSLYGPTGRDLYDAWWRFLEDRKTHRITPIHLRMGLKSFGANLARGINKLCNLTTIGIALVFSQVQPVYGLSWGKRRGSNFQLTNDRKTYALVIRPSFAKKHSEQSIQQINQCQIRWVLKSRYAMIPTHIAASSTGLRQLEYSRWWVWMLREELVQNV